MTPLGRPVRRAVRARDGEALVVTLAPEGVYIRAPRQRTKYPPIGYGALLLLAARAHVDERRRGKARRGRA